jgi:transcriptional regulator with XRE-family HTH domain
MQELNNLLKELGISKVKLSRYLGVSRQMVYNYLELKTLDEWPKDKKMRLFNLLGIKDNDEFKNIKVDIDYILKIEKKLQEQENDTLKTDFLAYDFKDLNKKQQQLLGEILDILKEMLAEDNNNTSYTAIKYLYHFLQMYNDSKEIKYVLAFLAKTHGFIQPREFIFNEEEQTTFEGIMFQAMNLFTNGGASRSKIVEVHNRFVEEMEAKREEKLSRTQELNTLKVQALKELNYTEINADNATEVFEKIAEIQSRKID